MAKSITIQKNPTLHDSTNYELLRQKGLEYIEKLGSRLWTDYNLHDPGITMLEALAYAITDLGLRTSLDMKDLLATPTPENAGSDGQFPSDKRQGLFTARNILTVNPWTIEDFRKLLINIDGVKNGWLNCKKCACDDLYLYANCKNSSLQYPPTEHQVIIKGLYDVWLEFEDEEKSGNLNSGKIKYKFSYKNGFQLANATIEMRLPSWAKLEANKQLYKNFRKPESKISKIEVKYISGSIPANADIPSSPEQVLDNALRRPVFAKVIISYLPDKAVNLTETLVFNDVPINLWFRNIDERRALNLNDLKTAIMDKTDAGIFPKYLEKIKRADAVVAETIQTLHNHRNLAEDFCSIKAIEVDDIAICADMEVEPSADIEAILAEAYYRIDQYMSPDIKFYSLQQLLDAQKPVDEIFEGPALSNGFIDNEELEGAALRTMLFTSDAINEIMDIPGVKSVKNLVFARYDDAGRLVESQPWNLKVSPNRQPRLYIEGSKVLVYKNGLPFLPDANELSDLLQVIKGKNTQARFSILENDLPVPHGNYTDLETYFAVQNSLPFTYGTGTDGLPDSASVQRKAQARQLKAYLLFFEQLLVNYLAQLAHTQELFAIDKSVSHTYFSRLPDASEIDGIADLFNGMDAATLQKLTENEDTFLERRNKFLDHLLARFAENFNDYALMLYSYTENKDIADSQLIDNKIAFLQEFPELSRNRAKAFNYKNPGLVCNNENTAGLAKRIKQLLGYTTDYSGAVELYEEKDTDGKFYERRWRMVDEYKKIQLSSSTRYYDENLALAEQKAWKEINRVFTFILKPEHYTIKKSKAWTVNLVDDTGEVIATRRKSFKTKLQAETARDQIIAYAEKLLTPEKIHIVEHVLLRPRKTGDALLPVCLSTPCTDCDETDPYSFRITLVLNGEEGLASKGMEYREFAEQTIRMETPAHIGVKICWVSRKQLAEFRAVYCIWLAELAKPEPDQTALSKKLADLIAVFKQLKNVYPQAALFDCKDGNDENRVILGYTAIISDEELDKQIENKKKN